MNLSMGDTIAGHKINANLGRGGMGMVLKATQVGSRKEVALKVLHTPQVGLFSLMREIEAIKALDHPGIVRLLDSGVEDGLVWYSMEYLDASTLRSLLPLHSSPNAIDAETFRLPTESNNISFETTVDFDGIQTQIRHDEILKEAKSASSSVQRTVIPLETAELKRPNKTFNHDTVVLLGYAAQIAEALMHLHGKGMIHCDLKPENVLITKDKHAVLIDFGLATIQGSKAAPTELSEAGMLLGTAMYMAPEKINRTTFDARVDLYALGCIIYQMIVGYEPLFHEETEILLGLNAPKRSTRPSQYIEGVPRELDDLVVSLLSKDPQKRPGYAAKVLDVIRRVESAYGIQRQKAQQPSPFLYRPPIIGRDQVTAQLKERIAWASNGKGSATLLTGESGIGKSILANFCLHTSRQKGIPCLSGRAGPLTDRETPAEGQSLGSFAAIFRNLVDRLNLKKEPLEKYFSPNSSALIPLFPFLSQLSELAQPPELTGLSDRDLEERTIDAVIDTIEKVAKNGPMTLVFDDIQWTDPLSLNCIKRLLNRVQTKRWFILLLSRSDLPTPESIEKHPMVDKMHLNPLEPVFHEPIIRHMLGGAKVPNSLLTYVENQTQGNPLYIRMCVQDAIDQDYLKLTSKGEWSFKMRMDELLSASSPRSLRALFQNSIAMLNDSERKICNVLAVFGQATSIDQLRDLTQLNGQLLQQSIDHLIRKSILHDSKEDALVRIDFVHWGISDPLMEHMPPNALQSLHLQIANLIEHTADHWESRARLARHLDYAGQTKRARELYVSAGKDARWANAIERALVLYERALTLYGNEQAADPVKIQFVKLVLMPRGFTEKSRAILTEVLKSTLQYDPILATKAKLRLVEAMIRSDMFDNVAEMIDECIVDYQKRNDLHGLASAKMQQAILQMELGNWQQGINQMESLRDFAIANDMKHTLETSTRNIGFAYLEIGKYQDALEVCMPLLKDAEAEHDEGNWIMLMNHIGLAHMYLGDLDMALSCSRAALQKAKKYGLNRLSVNIMGNMGLVHMQRENYAASIDIINETIALAINMGLSHVQRVSKVNILLCLVEMARFKKAAKLVEELELEKEKLGAYLFGYVLFGKARLLRYSNNPEHGLFEIQKAIEQFQSNHIKQPLAVAKCEEGHLLLALNSPTKAEQSFVAAYQSMKEMGMTSDSELGMAVDKLKRAMDALREGTTLRYGSKEADLPIDVLYHEEQKDLA